MDSWPCLRRPRRHREWSPSLPGRPCCGGVTAEDRLLGRGGVMLANETGGVNLRTRGRKGSAPMLAPWARRARLVAILRCSVGPIATGCEDAAEARRAQEDGGLPPIGKGGVDAVILRVQPRVVVLAVLA